MFSYQAGSIQHQTCEPLSPLRPLNALVGTGRPGLAGVSRGNPGRRKRWVLSLAVRSVVRWAEHETAPPGCPQWSPAGRRGSRKSSNSYIFHITLFSVFVFICNHARFHIRHQGLQLTAAAGCRCKAEAASAVKSRAEATLRPLHLQLRNRTKIMILLCLQKKHWQVWKRGFYTASQEPSS